jgi:hypothetical protein
MKNDDCGVLLGLMLVVFSPSLHREGFFAFFKSIFPPNVSSGSQYCSESSRHTLTRYPRRGRRGGHVCSFALVSAHKVPYPVQDLLVAKCFLVY